MTNTLATGFVTIVAHPIDALHFFCPEAAMSTDPHMERSDNDRSHDEQGDTPEFADTEDREGTDSEFRQEGREIMKRFRDAFASLAE